MIVLNFGRTFCGHNLNLFSVVKDPKYSCVGVDYLGVCTKI